MHSYAVQIVDTRVSQRNALVFATLKHETKEALNEPFSILELKSTSVRPSGAGADSSAPAMSVNTTAVAEEIKTDVAQLVAGINAHDAAKATAYDAPNVISMECGSPQRSEADKEGFTTMPVGKSLSSTKT